MAQRPSDDNIVDIFIDKLADYDGMKARRGKTIAGPDDQMSGRNQSTQERAREGIGASAIP